ncbi:DNA polymerase [Deltaproteobacteria bacterium]|nr:DNA polymerase [Deltaproteobacteria bacterium]
MNIVFDIEANGLSPTKIFCIVAQDVDTKEVFTFDNTQLEAGYLFLKSATKLIGHNIIGYDLPALKDVEGVDLSDKKIVDTLVLSRLFKPTREGGHGLESWGYRLGFNKGDYGESDTAWDAYTPEMLEYCQRDVELNTKVYEAVKLESRGFTPQAVRLEHAVSKIVDQQRRNGFEFDMRKAMLLVAMFGEKLQAVESEVHETFKPRVTTQILKPQYTKTGKLSKTAKDQHDKGVRLTDDEWLKMEQDGKPYKRDTYTEFNLGSRKQIGEYLIEAGWNPKNYTPTGQPIVDEGTLSKVKDIPEAQLIAKYLMLQKRLAQVNSWIKAVEPDGRVRGYVNPNGAVTGRMTHSHPNTAQVPSTNSPYGAECRACWTVKSGNKLVGIDASGLELRMLAHYMNDEDYTNEILNGDIHTANQKLAGLESRNQAKTFIYALLYGAGDAKLGSVAKRGKAVGKQLRRQFLDSLPSFKQLIQRVQRESKKGFLKGLDGRKLFVRSEHAALNTLLQSAGAIVMKEALVILDHNLWLKRIDAKIVANVHDEWQIECRASQAEKVGQLGVEAIIQAGKNLNLNCPLDGDYNIGDGWHETH